MKQILIYAAPLSLLLALSSAYGEEWERQMNAEAMMHGAPVTTGTMHHNWMAVENERRRQLGRGAYGEQDFDIENLPPTAAGPSRGHRMMKDWQAVEINRRRQLERGAY